MKIAIIILIILLGYYLYAQNFDESKTISL
jgi:hypothetical protein